MIRDCKGDSLETKSLYCQQNHFKESVAQSLINSISLAETQGARG